MFLCVIASSSKIPTEPEQTYYQKILVKQIMADAAIKSKAAEPALLAHFEQPLFRRGLDACCPSISKLPASELLRRLKEEVAVSEIVSGFDAASPSHSDSWWGMSIEEGRNGSYFENQWETRVNHNGSFMNSGGMGSWFTTQDDLEHGIYGLKAFKHRGAPASMDEAAERGPYCVVNTLKVDAGSPLYGSVSAVFSPARAKATILISSADTGSWSALCNQSYQQQSNLKQDTGLDHLLHAGLHAEQRIRAFDWPPSKYRTNCSQYPGRSGLGTLEDFSHLFLVNDAYWNSSGSQPLFSIFSRLFSEQEMKRGGWGTGHELSPQDFVTYWEAIPAANLQYTNGVKFLIGSFPGLFGTPEGTALRKWCIERSWVLVWSLGLNPSQDEIGYWGLNFWTVAYLQRTFPSNKRLLDAEVLVHTSAVANITIASAEQSYAMAWELAKIARTKAAEKKTIVANTTWAELWGTLAGQLPVALQLEPLRARSCADVEACVGLSGDGHCVCYNSSRSLAAWLKRKPSQTMFI